VSSPGGCHEIIAAGWYVGPTVVNIVTASTQPAEMKLTENHRLLPMGLKPSVNGVLELVISCL
jgi:hypothetical protein